MLKLPVEETKASIPDTTPGHSPSTPAGRRKVHLQQRTHEHLDLWNSTETVEIDWIDWSLEDVNSYDVTV